VRQRESEVLGKELLDVRTLDVVGLLELNDTENLDGCQYCAVITCYPPEKARGSIGRNAREST